MSRMLIRARFADWENSLQLAAWQLGNDGRTRRVSAVFTVHDDDKEGNIAEPFLNLDRKDAQQLFDELYRCGMRPSDGQPTSDQIAAIKYHLEDMRRLVFKPNQQERHE